MSHLAPPRLLLVEFIGTEPFPQTPGVRFPRFQGLARASSLSCQRLVVTLPLAYPPEGEGLVAPPEATLQELVDRARGGGFSHLLTSHPLSGAAHQALATASPALQLAALRGPEDGFDEAALAAWLGPSLQEERLARVAPDHEALGLDPVARRHLDSSPVLVGPTRCFRLGWAWSPAAGGEVRRDTVLLPLPVEAERFDREAWFRELSALAGLSARTEGRLALQIIGEPFLASLDQAGEALAQNLGDAADMVVMCLPQILVRHQAAVARGLECLAGDGHVLRLGLAATDCPQPALREHLFGLSVPEDTDVARRLLGEWQARWPETLQVFDALTMADTPLFSPWTTLGDLRACLDRFESSASGAESRYLTSHLRLSAGEPQVALLDAQGLRRESFDPEIFAPLDAQVAGADRGVPWAFAEVATATVHGVATRLLVDEPGRMDGGDPRFVRAQDLRRELGPRFGRAPVALLRHLVDLVQERGLRRVDELLDSLELQVVTGRPVERPDEPSGPQPGPSLREAAARIEAALGDQELPGGFTCAEVRAAVSAEDNEVIDILLVRAEERLWVNLLPRQSVRGSFALTERFAVCYQRDAGEDSAQREEALQAVAERVAEATD